MSYTSIYPKMTLVTGMTPGECLAPEMDSVELLDLLFDQQDGILRHENFQANGRESGGCWEMAQPSTHSGGSNKEILSSLLSETVPDSPPWSSAGSDSGISEDHLSDQLDSPQQLSSSPHNFEAFQSELPFHPGPEICCSDPCPGAPDVAYPDVDFSVSFGDWNTELLEDRAQHMPAPTAANNFISLTVKDLLLSKVSEKYQPQQHHTRELVLNEDEKKLLLKEGVTLPSQLPLTKQEERILKKIRRKIRNKQSAQESRKKKKEYIDGLENRMAACTTQNHELQRKVIHLEKQNMTLLQQLRKLQALVMQSTGKTAQSSTCVMVLVLSFSLILFPSFSSFSSSQGANEGDYTPVRVFSRSLHNVETARVHQVLANPCASAEKNQDWGEQLTFESIGSVSMQDQTQNGEELTGIIGSVSMQDQTQNGEELTAIIGSFATNGADPLLRNGTASKDIILLEELNRAHHTIGHSHSVWTEMSSPGLTPDHDDEM